jgi:3-hydroxyacyl-[acyl-carrier-protein] dehydratase
MGPDLPAPADILPHRPPFLFLDVVTELVPGRSARGRWRLTGAEPFFGGHFPGRPTLPGVLIVEALAQLGAVAVLADARFAGRLPLFGGVDHARFRRQVVPGDELEMSIEMSALGGMGGKGHGSAVTAAGPACEADLMFVFAK